MRCWGGPRGFERLFFKCGGRSEKREKKRKAHNFLLLLLPFRIHSNCGIPLFARYLSKSQKDREKA